MSCLTLISFKKKYSSNELHCLPSVIHGAQITEVTEQKLYEGQCFLS